MKNLKKAVLAAACVGFFATPTIAVEQSGSSQQINTNVCRGYELVLGDYYEFYIECLTVYYSDGSRLT